MLTTLAAPPLFYPRARFLFFVWESSEVLNDFRMILGFCKTNSSRAFIAFIAFIGGAGAAAFLFFFIAFMLFFAGAGAAAFIAFLEGIVMNGKGNDVRNVRSPTLSRNVCVLNMTRKARQASC